MRAVHVENVAAITKTRYRWNGRGSGREGKYPISAQSDGEREENWEASNGQRVQDLYFPTK
jgi:hypothetical protein